MLFLLLPALSYPGIYLFDASHEEMSANADWVIDSDSWDLYLEHYPCNAFADESNPQYAPTPDQSGIIGSTAETYWTGGISSWGIDLVQAGHTVYTLPNGGAITYGDGSNPYDLANYDVFIIPEPQQPFTSAEKSAILSFVSNGGGLFMVSDHQTSDRNCSGWDSPHVYNDLMGVVIAGGVVTDYGIFGLVFNVQEISSLTNTDYWFDDGIDNNVSTDPVDPIIYGPFGDGSGGLGFFGATSMTIDPATNPSVAGHVWKTDAGGQGTTRVTFVTALYGSGRIAAIGDSSPADDGTGDPGDSLYNGWDKASGGVANDIIHLNACDWLLYGDDTTPPVITTGPAATAGDCSATITWSTDEIATSLVDYGTTTAYGSQASQGGYRSTHSVSLLSLAPATLYHYRVSSSDPAGNGPTTSVDQTFTTAAATAPIITAGPQAGNVTGTSARITWTTDEPADSHVDYGETTAYGQSVSDASLVTDHAVTLTGLAPQTLYHYRISSTDGCGNGPTLSGDDTFTTTVSSTDIGGWTLKQFNSTQSFTFPAGTTIPGGGYLVLGRNAAQTAFESEWGPLPAGTVYVNSGGTCPMINGGESFELVDDTNATVDGVTISMSSGDTIQRINPGDPPGLSGSWRALAYTSADPGSGAGAGSSAGVVINEASDAGDYNNEFVELYYDAVGSVPQPDTTPPDPVTDLDAQATGGTTVHLTWSAPGDDGAAGTASSYDIRYSTAPIRTEADFTAALQISGEPAPQPAGSSETMDVTGLTIDTTYFFAIETSDEVPNTSSLSNSPGATTPSAGGDVDLSGWRIHQNASSVDWTIPAGTTLSSGSFLLVGRNGDQASFESYHGITCSGACTYLNSNPTGSCNGTNGCIPLINGGESYALYDDTSTLVDGTTVTLSSTHNTMERTDFCGSAGSSSSWSTSAEANATPGSSSSVSCNAGVVISEFSDAATYNYEFVEIVYDGAVGTPGNVGATLFLDGPGTTTLRWGKAYGADHYNVRKGTTPDFMQTPPAPFYQGAATTTTDAAIPPAGTAFYYFIKASDGTNESKD